MKQKQQAESVAREDRANVNNRHAPTGMPCEFNSAPNCQGSHLGLQPSWNARGGEASPGKGQVNEPTTSNTLIHPRPQPIIRISIRIRIMSMPPTGDQIAA